MKSDKSERGQNMTTKQQMIDTQIKAETIIAGFKAMIAQMQEMPSMKGATAAEFRAKVDAGKLNGEDAKAKASFFLALGEMLEINDSDMRALAMSLMLDTALMQYFAPRRVMTLFEMITEEACPPEDRDETLDAMSHVLFGGFQQDGIQAARAGMMEALEPALAKVKAHRDSLDQQAVTEAVNQLVGES